MANDPRACVLLDIAMTGPSGMQVQARRNDMGIHQPDIAVSARDDAETRAWTRGHGARMRRRRRASCPA